MGPCPDPALGATPLPDGSCHFVVWAPRAQAVEVHLLAPVERLFSLRPSPRGYHEAVVADVPQCARYLYRLDGERERPDPTSRSQPQGVHGPSQVVSPSFPWQEGAYQGLAIDDAVFYELHVGTFTPEGTFDAVIPHLPYLAELGVTAIELMPVAQFPGGRNWGYDGTYPFAVQESYGGPDGLKRLVDACHRHGLAVFLDVVYNHLGPEGNYLHDFGPYFTDRHRTLWGAAVNLDGPGSDEVRRFFTENARRWIREFHMDGLRLDAVHAMVDLSARPFLAELAESVHEEGRRRGRPAHLIAESESNDPRLARPPAAGGLGLDAQWADDLHHALHTLLTGERNGYYQDFGEIEHLRSALEGGFAYTGEFSPSRGRRHGSPSRDLPTSAFVVCAQNHDQVGNRMLGERLTRLLSQEALRLAAAVVLLGAHLPLLFMGEEYGEIAPFPYFVSHGDPALIEAVRAGRREEFAAFAWQGQAPDPQGEATFASAVLDHALRERAPHRRLLHFYQELLRLRRALPALRSRRPEDVRAITLPGKALLLLRRCAGAEAAAVFRFGRSGGPAQAQGDPLPREVPLSLPPGRWRLILDSTQPRWSGHDMPAPLQALPEVLDTTGDVLLPLPPCAAALYSREELPP